MTNDRIRIGRIGGLTNDRIKIEINGGLTNDRRIRKNGGVAYDRYEYGEMM